MPLPAMDHPCPEVVQEKRAIGACRQGLIGGAPKVVGLGLCAVCQAKPKL